MHNKPCNPGPHDYVDMRSLEALYRKIEAKFATNKQVLDVIADLKKLEAGTALNSVHVAQAAAAMVIKSVKGDLDELRNKINAAENKKIVNIEVVPFTDKYGHPVITTRVDYNRIYITPSDNAGVDGDVDNQWDEWIAVPAKSKSWNGREHYRWERIGSKRIDISWVKKDIEGLNKKLNDICKQISNLSDALANAILEKMEKPIAELRDYIKSEEYIKYVWEKLPRASVGNDGLMPANSFALLSMLAVWAANDHKSLGGGALGPDVVIHMLEKQGIDCDDLRKYFHHSKYCDDSCNCMD